MKSKFLPTTNYIWECFIEDIIYSGFKFRAIYLSLRQFILSCAFHLFTSYSKPHKAMKGQKVLNLRKPIKVILPADNIYFHCSAMYVVGRLFVSVRYRIYVFSLITFHVVKSREIPYLLLSDKKKMRYHRHKKKCWK